ncbi:Uncharacterised protein [Vibrio cholerae]|nr:Uncharacterised protein [Vibrio cholerae]
MISCDTAPVTRLSASLPAGTYSTSKAKKICSSNAKETVRKLIFFLLVENSHATSKIAPIPRSDDITPPKL